MDGERLLGVVWLPLDSWIVAVGILCAVSCALLGSFLVLRQMSMMGDAISHAVLPGLATAFLLTGSRSSVVMLLGAGVVGVLTALFTEWVHRVGKVDPGASMGVVFTVLFAGGLLLLVRAADHVDLDPGCVLYGAIEAVPLDTVTVAGFALPRAVLPTGGVLIVNLLVVTLLFKELKLSTFDPALATTLGVNARFFHYLLMVLVAVTTVSAFESVGSILVIAMLIVPAATARLLSDRLAVVLLLSCVLAAASAGLGHLAAITVPGWIGYPEVSTNSAGMMAATAGMLFTAAMLLAPRHGVLGRLFHRVRLSLRIVREDLLGHLFRIEEAGTAWPSAAVLCRNVVGAGQWMTIPALWLLRREGAVERKGELLVLTETGRAAARQLVRSHRLWETFFDAHSRLPSDHLHRPAETLEHVTDSGLQQRLAESVGDPGRDPHGSPIPRNPT